MDADLKKLIEEEHKKDDAEKKLFEQFRPKDVDAVNLFGQILLNLMNPERYWLFSQFCIECNYTFNLHEVTSVRNVVLFITNAIRTSDNEGTFKLYGAWLDDAYHIKPFNAPSFSLPPSKAPISETL